MSKHELKLWRMAVWKVIMDEYDTELAVFCQLWYGSLMDAE